MDAHLKARFYFVIEYLKALEITFQRNRNSLYLYTVEKSIIQQTSALIARDFGLDIGEEPLSEQELFDLLADQVAYMIEHRLDTLFSLMYRLDVKESLIRQALDPGAEEMPNIAIAKLILERQKNRIYTKIKYRQKPLDDMEGFW